MVQSLWQNSWNKYNVYSFVCVCNELYNFWYVDHLLSVLNLSLNLSLEYGTSDNDITEDGVYFSEVSRSDQVRNIPDPKVAQRRDPPFGDCLFSSTDNTIPSVFRRSSELHNYRNKWNRTNRKVRGSFGKHFFIWFETLVERPVTELPSSLWVTKSYFNRQFFTNVFTDC